MENKIADLELELEELKSSITILQKATNNESEEIVLKDINNYLELTQIKIKEIIKNFNNLKQNLQKQ